MKVAALFPSRQDAEEAVNDLMTNGFSDIELVHPPPDRKALSATKKMEAASTGATALEIPLTPIGAPPLQASLLPLLESLNKEKTGSHIKKTSTLILVPPSKHISLLKTILERNGGELLTADNQ